MEISVEDLPTPSLVKEHVMLPVLQPNVEPPAQQPDESDASPIDGKYDMEEKLLEGFCDLEYEQDEGVDVDDSDVDVFFKLIESLDIGDET